MNRGRLGALALAAAMTTLGFAATAGAQDAQKSFGRAGDWVIGADRLVPLISYTSETVPGTTGNGETIRNSGGGISLLWGEANQQAPNFFTVPRVGLDYFLTDMITLGGEAGGAFSTGGASYDTTVNGSSTSTTKTPLPSWDELMIGVRAGAVFKLTDMISFWPRGGFSYNWVQTKATTTSSNNAGAITTSTNSYISNTVSELSLDIDPQLVFSPWRHVGFTAGLTAGIPLASCATQHGHSTTVVTGGGSTTTTTIDGHVSTNANNWYVGANLGALVYF